MAIKYNKETLDTALAYSNGDTLEERKKGEKILSMASRLELGSRSTKPVQEWFISHTDEIISMMSHETDSRLLWGYIHMLSWFCDRYINYAHLTRDNDDFINDPRTKHFKEQAYFYVESMIATKDMKVLSAVGCFLSTICHDKRAWDLFAIVLQKKRDKMTLTNIKQRVSRCRRLTIEKETICDIWGNPLSYDEVISKEQIITLREVFQNIESKTMASDISDTIKELDELLEAKASYKEN